MKVGGWGRCKGSGKGGGGGGVGEVEQEKEEEGVRARGVGEGHVVFGVFLVFSAVKLLLAEKI